MKTILSTLAATFVLASLSGAAAAADLTPLHPALLSPPVFTAHADSSRLLAPAQPARVTLTTLHPALLGAPIYTAHADASGLLAQPAATVVQSAQNAE